jgi:protein-S-isoprenylcysteine O-methyltransferase Ste14
MGFKLALKAVITTLLIPGTVIVLIPYFILRRSGICEWPAVSGLTVFASVTGMAGLAVLLHCIRGFAIHGRGTLAPIDPPKILIVRGLYRYTRNPMYLAVIVVLLSEALFFSSTALLAYAAAVLTGFHLFVVLYEEPHLRSQFGRSFDEYRKAVPRWRITTRGFTSSGRASGPQAQ